MLGRQFPEWNPTWIFGKREKMVSRAFCLRGCRIPFLGVFGIPEKAQLQAYYLNAIFKSCHTTQVVRFIRTAYFMRWEREGVRYDTYGRSTLQYQYASTSRSPTGTGSHQGSANVPSFIMTWPSCSRVFSHVIPLFMSVRRLELLELAPIDSRINDTKPITRKWISL